MFRKRGTGTVQAPPDTPILYVFPRGPFAPSQSPFVIKLETFCRMAKIPYKVDCTGRFSSQDKIPWMTFNGHVVEDSQMCIEYLKVKVGVDFNSHLDAPQKAVAQMIRVLVENHLYWVCVMFRYVYCDPSFPEYLKSQGMGGVKFWFIRRHIRNEAEGQGLGRHSKEELTKFLMKDLTSLSEYLGDKPYMLGEEMCEADCAVFGLLSQVEYHHFNNEVFKGLLEAKFPNLQRYVHRIKDELWQDWDECCKRQSCTSP